MKIAVIQFEPIFNQKDKNLSKIHSYINNIDAQLLIFPELCLTGYYFLNREEVNEVAETSNSDFIMELQSLSSRINKGIVLGFPEKDYKKQYNSCCVILPDENKSRIYRKTHLFYKERFCFDPGDSGFFVIDYPEWDVNIGPMICYDWRFPESARTLALKGADLIVCPSNLVTNVWQSALSTRALENNVYIAVSNRIGSETRNGETLLFNGDSTIYDYKGNVLVKAGPDDEKVIKVDIEPKKTRLKSFNEFNDIFKDRRPDMYKIK
ncbi:MAG: carbon-nitrogen hydrolase [Bacteroidetes bacterium]|nr:MAG: carbon-nitrogen hydrolase [Bacteroidota bacterium]